MSVIEVGQVRGWHGRLGDLGQAADWQGVYSAQRREAERRYGKVIIQEPFAATAFPNISRDEGLALVQWWNEQLGRMTGTASAHDIFAPISLLATREQTLSENERIDLQNFATMHRYLKGTSSWGNLEIKGAWDAALLAAQRLSASKAAVTAAEANTWVRAFKESAEDILDPDAPDPFGIGKFLRALKTVLIAGAVVVGGIVVLNAIQAARQALPPASGK